MVVIVGSQRGPNRFPSGDRHVSPTRRVVPETTETGSVSAFVVLLMVTVMAMMGLVVDGGRAMSAQQSAFDEAEQAARAGAGALSVSALRAGSVQIDPAAAVTAAEDFTVADGHPGVATVSDGVVRVQISYRIQTQVLGIVHITTLPVSASATAVDEEGVTEGSP
jgi:Flp pilus assembly protein TadG